MKLELFGSASAGFFALVGAFLNANGSSWLICTMAVIGALVAVLELETFVLRKVLMLFLFNGLVGTFGGPFLMQFVGLELEALPQGALLLLPFMLGWASHTALSQVRDIAITMLKKRIGGAAK